MVFAGNGLDKPQQKESFLILRALRENVIEKMADSGIIRGVETESFYLMFR